MAAKPLVPRGKGLSDRPQTCGLRARFPDCLSTHRFACFDGQQSGRECIFLRKCKHLHPQFAIVDLHRSQARLQLSLLTGLTMRCFAHRARASCAPQKIPEMTYTPSFLMRASFFRDFVNTLNADVGDACPRPHCVFCLFKLWFPRDPRWTPPDALKRGWLQRPE